MMYRLGESVIKVGVMGGAVCGGIELLRQQEGETVVVLPVIKILVKGLVSHVLQSMDILSGMPEASALNVVPLLP